MDQLKQLKKLKEKQKQLPQVVKEERREEEKVMGVEPLWSILSVKNIILQFVFIFIAGIMLNLIIYFLMKQFAHSENKFLKHITKLSSFYESLGSHGVEGFEGFGETSNIGSTFGPFAKSIGYSSASMGGTCVLSLIISNFILTILKFKNS